MAKKKPADVPQEAMKETASNSFPFGANAMAKTKTTSNKKKPAAKAKSGSDKVREYYADHPEAKQSEIAKAAGVAPSQVSSVLKALGVTGKKKKTKSKAPKAAKATVNANGHIHSPSDFVKAAFALGLDKAIETLEKVKKAIE